MAHSVQVWHIFSIPPEEEVNAVPVEVFVGPKASLLVMGDSERFGQNERIPKVTEENRVPKQEN